jgi:diadenylate cyclase
MSQLLANLAPFRAVTGSFYLTDFFDVVIIAVFIYAALLLFKRTRSITILIGIGIIVVLYGVSIIFNLTLTAVFLQSFFGAFLLVLVIIFQEELRRFFEILAVWGTRQKNQDTSSLKGLILDPVVQGVLSLARHKTGAILVFTGTENVERHCEGNIVLDGIISQELIESIFDTNSPGHDGAMIITGNRIASIGAQLPLSHNFDQVGKYGTRHAAALGIAERSDAVAIVVSEEKGTVSVAQKDKLTKISDAQELTAILRKFYRLQFPTHSRTMWQKIIAQNLPEKLAALVISIGLWFFLVYQVGTVQREFEIPISYQDLPNDVVIEDFQPRTVTVTLESRGQSFDQLDKNSLEIFINGRSIVTGEQDIQIIDSMVRRPFAFSVVNVNPGNLTLTADRYKPQEITLEALTRGTVATGFRVDEIIINPTSARLLVSETRQIPAKIQLEPINISGLKSTISRAGILRLPDGVRQPENTNLDIAVTVVIKKR